ncbi:hypothetical protein GCM10023331_16490 [Algivirga pacifica]|uniref:Beta-N-acetylhexosaminidase n=2 Tax=Algivirga pacifica TaxID=1162670 RepID=A0ABP9D7U6_9BACT
MPVPAKVTLANSHYSINKDFTVELQGSSTIRLQKAATRFVARLRGRTGISFSQDFIKGNGMPSPNGLLVKVEKEGTLALNMDESYTLQVTDEKILLEASTDIGALRGLETLLQLVEVGKEGFYLPTAKIEDQPRFPWRGLMLDVSRHFLPLEVVKRNIAAMAAVKMNVFHWHLTDDHGIRVESKVYPQLHEKASDGMYYTQEQIKEVIAFAAERGIRVVPEFDLPGHATAWCVAFPELASAPYQYMADAILDEKGMMDLNVKTAPYHIERNAGIFDATLDPTNEKTYEVVGNFLNEMAALFPDVYMHIGGDENEGKQWDANPEIQAFMKEHNIADNHMLQNHFNKRVLKMMEANGKRMVGWDEILVDGLPKNAVIQSWRGKESLAQAAKDGYQVMLSNGYYIDLMHPAEHHYLQDPLPDNHDLTEQQAKNVLGGEATMWSELVTPETVDSRIWPRTAAIAERLWSPAEVKDVEDMYRRLSVINWQLEELGLQHLTYQEKLFRNLARGYDIEPLKVLARVAVPLRFYNRNSMGWMYTTYGSSYRQFVDALGPDARDARDFNEWVEAYLDGGDLSKEQAIADLLAQWQGNHIAIQQLINKSPALEDIENLSYRLSEAARVTLEALQLQEQPSYEWYRERLDIIDQARFDGPTTKEFLKVEKQSLAKGGSRATLPVVTAMERILKVKAGQLMAYRTRKDITVDGVLEEWKEADWQVFTNGAQYTGGWYKADSAWYALRWDKQHLYLAFKVKDSDVTAVQQERDGAKLWEDDGIEVLFDPLHHRSAEWQEDDIAYHVSAANIIMDEKGMKGEQYDASWTGNAITAVKVKGTLNEEKSADWGYTVEMAVSWDELGVKPKKDTALGMTLCVNDKNSVTETYEYFDYMHLKVFHAPHRFATLRLSTASEEKTDQKTQ